MQSSALLRPTEFRSTPTRSTFVSARIATKMASRGSYLVSVKPSASYSTILYPTKNTCRLREIANLWNWRSSLRTDRTCPWLMSQEVSDGTIGGQSLCSFSRTRRHFVLLVTCSPNSLGYGSLSYWRSVSQSLLAQPSDLCSDTYVG
jgi:hypothetical protein